MEHIKQHVTDRANKEFEWYPTDTVEQYKPFNDYGANLYKPGDFTYKFNSDGFRCDEFDLKSELPILFIGCSVTEGIGLPVEHTWSYLLHQEIRKLTGKNIPYWNIAQGGAGIDTQASLMYWLSKRIKPTHVFGLLPPFLRREFKHGGPDLKWWAAGIFDKSPIDRVFIDQDNCNYESQRSLMLIDSLCKANNSTCDVGYWSYTEEDIKILKDFSEFSSIKYAPWTPRMTDLSRDSIHVGPEYHRQFAKYMLWQAKIRNYF
jgi:hypothetical protein